MTGSSRRPRARSPRRAGPTDGPPSVRSGWPAGSPAATRTPATPSPPTPSDSSGLAPRAIALHPADVVVARRGRAPPLAPPPLGGARYRRSEPYDGSTLRSADVAGDAGGVHRAVAERVLVQVLLVVVLGVVEVRRRLDLGGDPAVARPGELGLELLADPLRDSELLVAGGVDRRAVLRAHVVALAHALGRVVVLEEDLQQLLVAHLLRVVADLDDLGVPGPGAAHLLVGGVRGEAARVAGRGVGHARGLPEQLLRAPETTEGEVGHLGPVRDLLDRDTENVVERGIDQDRGATAPQRLVRLDQGGLGAGEQHEASLPFSPVSDRRRLPSTTTRRGPVFRDRTGDRHGAVLRWLV